MNTLMRFLLIVLLVILLGVGLRLLYYGIQLAAYTSSASTASYLPSPLIFAAGIVCFLGGIVAGVFVLTPHYDH